MPLAFKIAGIQASGTDVVVIDFNLRGLRDNRLMIRNAGDQSLTALKVRTRDAVDGIPASIDETTFASLGPGEAKSAVLAGPIERLEILATCAFGTELDITVTDGISP